MHIQYTKTSELSPKDIEFICEALEARKALLNQSEFMEVFHLYKLFRDARKGE